MSSLAAWLSLPRRLPHIPDDRLQRLESLREALRPGWPVARTSHVSSEHRHQDVGLLQGQPPSGRSARFFFLTATTANSSFE